MPAGGWLAFENRVHWNVAEHFFCLIQLCYQQTYTLKTGMLVENGDSILTLWWGVSFSQINFCLCIVYSGVSNIEADSLSQAPRKISGRPHKQKKSRGCHKKKMSGSTTRAYLQTISRWTSHWFHPCKQEMADKIRKHRSRDGQYAILCLARFPLLYKLILDHNYTRHQLIELYVTVYYSS